MSHYTYLNFQFAVPKKHKKVIDILDKAYCRNRKPKSIPRHEFFKTEHWRDLFFMEDIPLDPVLNGYYETKEYTVFHLHGKMPWEYELVLKFTDWLGPYAKGVGVGIIGWSMYETDKTPEFYYGEL